MTAAIFVAGMAGGLLGLAIGWRVATAGARVTLKYYLEALETQDDELRAKDAELAKAGADNEALNRNIETAFNAGIVQGQLLRADREAEGL